MRLGTALAGMVLLAGCTPAVPRDATVLTLNNPYWDRVNVQLVITKRDDCASRGDGFISTKDVVMAKNRTETIVVPAGANVCWRRDRNPSEPAPGVWSGWTKATLFPGAKTEANL
jgi:hypothetical protein